MNRRQFFQMTYPAALWISTNLPKDAMADNQLKPGKSTKKRPRRKNKKPKPQPKLQYAFEVAFIPENITVYDILSFASYWYGYRVAGIWYDSESLKGFFVTAINDNKRKWIYTVNGFQPGESVSNYYVNEGDIIVFQEV